MISEFGRFLLVGASNTLMTWTLVFLLAGPAGLPAALANAIGWTAGSIWSYYWNRRYSFRVRSTSGMRRQALLFAGVSLGAVALSTGIVALFVARGLLVAEAIATAAALAWNFALFRLVVFRLR